MGYTYPYRDIQASRHTHRGTQGQAYTDRDSHTDKQFDIHKGREKPRDTYRQTNIHTYRQTYIKKHTYRSIHT